MSKISCIVLCAVALSFLGAVYAEEESPLRNTLKPFINECKSIHGVTDADLIKATETKTTDGVKPCFLACVFKKAEIIDANGKFDKNTTFSKIKEILKSDSSPFLAKLKEIGENCESVNDEAVSDGAEGCERAALLANCIIDHKAKMFV